MHILLIIILAIVVSNTIADESTCTKNNQPYYSEFIEDNNNYFRCTTHRTIVCKNLISPASLEKSQQPCYYGFCDELIISSSFLTIFDDKVIDTTSFCKLFKLTINASRIKSIGEDAFHSLSQLHVLNLDNNEIQHLTFLSHLVNLYSLSLEMNNLCEIDAKDLSQLSKLQKLNLAHNKIQTLGNSSYILGNLKELYLNHNNISFVNFNVLSKLTRLEILNMADNELIFIDGNLLEPLTLLRSVNFENNKIHAINYSFQDVRGHTRFYFNNNNISIISKNLFSNSWANVISFNHSGIRNIEPNAFQNIDFHCDVNRYCDKFDNSIFINNNNISIIKHNSFGNITNLKSLIMRNNSIQAIEKYAFDKLQFSESSTAIIDVSNNLLSIIQNNTFFGIKNAYIVVLDNNMIQKIIPGAFNTLIDTRILKLSYNDLKVIEENLFVGLNNLKELYLDNNKLQKIIPGAFNTLKDTRILKLSYNDLKVIEENNFVGLNNLEELYLDNNKLQTLMFNSFNGLERLTKLKLDNNQLKSIPVGTFRNVYSLKVLMLNGNELAKLMTGVFTNLKNLNVLNLGNNNFSILNCNAFFPLTGLQDLYLNNNSIFDVDYVSLDSHCPELVCVSLNFNYFNCTFLKNMLQYFRKRGIKYDVLIQDKIYHDESIDGILCSENVSLRESEKPPRNKSHNLQHNIFSININPHDQDDNDLKLGSILKNISNISGRMQNESSEFMKNITDLFLHFKNAENNLTAEKESREFIKYGNSGFQVFISMTAFAILLLLVIKTFKKTYFYRIKSVICRERKPEIELIDTSEI